jgi:hypothetical protein
VSRALATFGKAGLTVHPGVPSAEALFLSSRAIHERLGLLWYRLRGWA